MRATVELGSALSAAECGLLVIFTVHARTCDEVFDRLIGAFPADDRQMARKRFARAVLAVSTQTLLARSDKPGRVAAFDVFIPDAASRQDIENGRGLAARGTLPPGSQRIAEHIARLLADGVISKETADNALAEAR